MTSEMQAAHTKNLQKPPKYGAALFRLLRTLATVPVTPNQFIKLALNEVNEQELAES